MMKNEIQMHSFVQYHNCFGVMKGECQQKIQSRIFIRSIEHFATTTGMRLSMISPEEENNDQDLIRH